MKKLLLILLVLLVGCEKQYEPSTPKFQRGDLIKYRGSDIEGIVVAVFPIRNSAEAQEFRVWEDDNDDITKVYLGVNYYKVSFTTKTQIGIDTAAGAGFLGDTDHYPPTFISTRFCEEFELEKR